METLLNFQLGKLSLTQSQKVAVHLETCEQCDEQFSGIEHSGDNFVQELRQYITVSGGQFGNTSVSQVSQNSNQTILKATETKRTLGSYLLEEPIGQGGLGTVWRATHRDLKRAVALKVIKPERINEADTRQRFFREMEALGKLSHPNLVQAYDAGEVDGQPFLAMELLDGSDLSELVRRTGSISVSKTCDIIVQASKGLAHAHQFLGVHRDLKPQNMMLTTDGIVKILDLGLARFSDDQVHDETITLQNQILGTPDYMSPEQFRDASRVTEQSDIYSLGCVMYYLLTGKAPYAGMGITGIVEKAVIHQTATIPDVRETFPEVDQNLSEYLKRMLAKEPAQRPSSMSAVEEELTKYASGDNSTLISLLERAHSPQTFNDIAVSADKTTQLFNQRESKTVNRQLQARWIRIIGGIALLLLLVSLIGRGWMLQPPSSVDLNAAASEQSPVTKAVLQAIDGFSLPEPLHNSILLSIKRTPEASCWTGESGDQLFSICVQPLPGQISKTRLQPAWQRKVTVSATAHLLRTKVLLSHFKAAGLTDAAALQTVFQQIATQPKVTGEIKGFTERAVTVGDDVIALVYANSKSINASGTTETTVALMRSAYRDVLHQQSRRLMQQKEWKESLRLWKHLHALTLVTPELYLDAARCFQELGQEADALQLLEKSMATFADTTTSNYMEQLGNLAATLNEPGAEQLAIQAYTLALERFTMRETSQQDESK